MRVYLGPFLTFDELLVKIDQAWPRFFAQPPRIVELDVVALPSSVFEDCTVPGHIAMLSDGNNAGCFVSNY